ncbi:MAG: aldo/keto reductase [Paralcaligenes sp.]
MRDSSTTISRIILGGHEYLRDGRSRAFNEDMEKAITPGYLFPRFGGEQRLAVVERALRLGITTFDVTTDSEKEALGRNFIQLDVGSGLVVQTRPEGMVYGYDEFNRKLVEPGCLRDEVRRILDLMQRNCLDILNIGILSSAEAHDLNYIAKLADVVHELKSEGLIRCAAADTFSGANTYLSMIRSDAFETMNLNFNFANDAALEEVIPAARERGLRVVAREIFIKGALFGMAQEIGLEDKGLVARAAMKWVAGIEGIDALILGADNPNQLEEGVQAAMSAQLSAEEDQALSRLQGCEQLRLLRARNYDEFVLESR